VAPIEKCGSSVVARGCRGRKGRDGERQQGRNIEIERACACCPRPIAWLNKTLNPDPSTLIPKASTLKPKLSTPNPRHVSDNLVTMGFDCRVHPRLQHGPEPRRLPRGDPAFVPVFPNRNTFPTRSHVSLYFPVTCNPSKVVTLPNIGILQCIGVPHRVTCPYSSPLSSPHPI